MRKRRKRDADARLRIVGRGKCAARKMMSSCGRSSIGANVCGHADGGDTIWIGALVVESTANGKLSL